MTDTTYNRKAAEIMGAKFNPDFTIQDDGYPKGKPKGTEMFGNKIDRFLKYNSSFDWQIPLWQKIWKMVCDGAGNYSKQERSSIDIWVSEYEFCLLTKSAEDCFVKLFPLIDFLEQNTKRTEK